MRLPEVDPDERRDAPRLLVRAAALLVGGSLVAAVAIAMAVVVLGGVIGGALYAWNLRHCVVFCTEDYFVDS